MGIYVVGEDLNLLMPMEDVRRFDRLWKDGVNVLDIARELDKDPDEIAILVIDRIRKGNISQRANGAWGSQHGEGKQ